MRTHLACAQAVAAMMILVASAHAADTLWIFDADFEDLIGDNSGWTSEDWSGSIACTNFWHKDTIRIDGYDYLGDSTWWCGKYASCWIQPRGYGNDWTCHLMRSFPELASVSSPGDDLRLEYDQRWAMEACYDYGYTEISTDAGQNWTTIHYVTNPGFACSQPGPSQDWNSACPWGMCGHTVLDLSEYAGQPMDLRFRFESDQVYSSQDAYDNPPNHSCVDGAWQIDNVAWYVNDELYWLDDCESPGHNGWQTPDTPASGQTGVVFGRSYEEDLDGHSGWMMTAYDEATGVMTPGQSSRLISPPIELGGSSDLIVTFDGWLDLPGYYDNTAKLRHIASDDLACLEKHLPRYSHSDWFAYQAEPGWVSISESLSTSGEEWLALAFDAFGNDAPEPHGMGLVLDRVRVGVPLETGVTESGPGGRLTVRPNPFSGSATVEYVVPTTGPVTLRVYDLAGHLVASLATGVCEAGAHALVWDGTTSRGARAAAGVYFVEMRSEREGHSHALTQKLVLLK